jgi:hypothetical protein
MGRIYQSGGRQHSEQQDLRAFSLKATPATSSRVTRERLRPHLRRVKANVAI